MTAPELDICLVSGADEIRYRSYVNHAAYARLHGLDYRLECGIGPDIQNAFYYKLQAIRNVLPRYDWIVWIDDDCYITDIHSDRIRTLIDAAEANGEVLVVAEGPVEPNGFWSTLNSGVFALRNDSDGRELLISLDRLDPTQNRRTRR